MVQDPRVKLDPLTGLPQVYSSRPRSSESERNSLFRDGHDIAGLSHRQSAAGLSGRFSRAQTRLQSPDSGDQASIWESPSATCPLNTWYSPQENTAKWVQAASATADEIEVRGADDCSDLIPESVHVVFQPPSPTACSSVDDSGCEESRQQKHHGFSPGFDPLLVQLKSRRYIPAADSSRGTAGGDIHVAQANHDVTKPCASDATKPGPDAVGPVSRPLSQVDKDEDVCGTILQDSSSLALPDRQLDSGMLLQTGREDSEYAAHVEDKLGRCR
jgi:hypothetical protein